MAAEDRNGDVVSAQAGCTDCGTSASSESSFDELARGLASGTISRRRALRMLGGAVMGSVLASVPGVAWAAKPGPCPKKCGKRCCPDISFVCSQGKCACPSGTTQCGGSCLEPATFQTDPSNCGSCGNSCSGGKTCQSGVCACPQGQTVCGGGVCRDLATDEANCGICGNACSTGASCVGGTCQCPSGQTPCGGQCVEVCAPPKVLNTSCQCQCPTNQTCTGSGGTINPTTCECECPGGKTLCQGQCVSSCDATIGEVLNPTTCQCECASGLTRCGNQCVNTATDPNNCGSCGNRCTDGASCDNGACVPICINNCCCNCQYVDVATGTRPLNTCDPATTFTQEQCKTFCENSVPPPGYRFHTAQYGCASEHPGETIICDQGPLDQGGVCVRAKCVAP